MFNASAKSQFRIRLCRPITITASLIADGPRRLLLRHSSSRPSPLAFSAAFGSSSTERGFAGLSFLLTSPTRWIAFYI
jgi:hypothetical protein